MNLTLSAQDEVVLKVTAAELQIIFAGLDELIHKVAKPVEWKLMTQVEQALGKHDAG